MPDVITRSSVYLAWLGLAAIGMVGIGLYLAKQERRGLVLMGLYAALGFAGLLHYARAEVAAHTAMMNFTIWFEVVTAGALLFAVAIALGKSHRQG